jgi:hypothetical protein
MKVRRPSGSVVISVALHLVLGAALLWVLSIPYPFQSWLTRQKTESMPVERISFLAVPNHGTNTPGQSGGDNRPITQKRTPTRPLTAPPSVPTALPPAPPRSTAPAAPSGGTGPVVGNGSEAREGITPSYSDPRLWLPPGPVVSAPKSTAERLDSALASSIRAHEDSMAELAGPPQRAPGDWTFNKNGKKYGIDSRKIYLGKFSIPTAILALLPLNAGGNPTEIAQERALNYQRKDIMYQAQRAMNEEEFREAVKRIRERKQREHDEEMKRRKEQQKKEADQVVHP